MAISLSNHEDRIKKLEEIKSTGFKSTMLYNQWRALQDKLETLVTLSEIPDLIYIEVSFGGPTDTLYFDTVLIPFNTMIDNYNFFISSVNIGDHQSTRPTVFYGKYLSASKELQFGVKNSIQNDDGIKSVYGLKLYYNFSYNIYRLANSILFHFFKCLINSFKGGVKEICQLV